MDRRGADEADLGDPPPGYVQQRFVGLFHAVVSKVFWAGFFWEFFGEVFGDNDYHTVKYAVLTGLGDSSGVFTGHMLYFTALGGCALDAAAAREWPAARLLATVSLLTGTAWQPLVNLCLDTFGFDFLGTFFFVGAVSGLIFFCGLRVGRRAFDDEGAEDAAGVYKDASLALSIAGAEAFFVCTTPARLTSKDFSMFSVYDNDGWLLASWKAGASVAAGFILVQVLQNLVVPFGYTWVDTDPPQPPKDDAPLLSTREDT